MTRVFISYRRQAESDEAVATYMTPSTLRWHPSSFECVLEPFFSVVQEAEIVLSWLIANPGPILRCLLVYVKVTS